MTLDKARDLKPLGPVPNLPMLVHETTGPYRPTPEECGSDAFWLVDSFLMTFTDGQQVRFLVTPVNNQGYFGIANPNEIIPCWYEHCTVPGCEMKLYAEAHTAVHAAEQAEMQQALQQAFGQAQRGGQQGNVLGFEG